MRAYACSEEGCTESFDSKPALKRHRERVHGDIKYWCGECGLTTSEDGTQQRVGFTTELLLQAHLKKEHQTCLFCEFKSSSRYELEQHVEMYHSGKTVKDRKTHACTHPGCDKKFTKKSNLKAHIRTAHEGFRFICGEVTLAGPDFEGWTNDQGCGDKFSTKVRLEDHVRFIHLGYERPKLSKPDVGSPSDFIDEISGVANMAKQTIVCPQCSEAFIRYHDLQLHLAKDHDPAALGVDPSSLLSQDVDSVAPFGHVYDQSVWPDDMQEELFAAQMDYGPPKDDWLQDEENILLLTRDSPREFDPAIDPALC